MVRDVVRLHTNLTTTQRAASLVLGLGLAAVAARAAHDKLLRLPALVAGAALAMRRATGHCSMKAILHHG
ncbi:YgaP-like transmembrane domain [Methylobacterium sp. UNC378MF]|uniref:YgaP-like transmembrane domain n=1 Tax=Methylobacterium sp. UNC378MF TaxID=1502748 RepID=UPI000B81BED2|nr:YgaP-like transmembrane domain [Methylobacterium sp. UNC378MF]